MGLRRKKGGKAIFENPYCGPSIDISYEKPYTVITGILIQTPYAGKSFVSGGLRARGIFVQRH